MDMYKQKLFSRETSNAYQILLHITQLIQSLGHTFTDFDRFYELLNGDNEDDVAKATDRIYKNKYEFPINFFALESSGDNMFQDQYGKVAVGYVRTLYGLMNDSDFAICHNYLKKELDKVVPKIVKEIYSVIMSGGAMSN